MFYWFERAGAYIRCESRSVGNQFELRIANPDGTECIEQFTASSDLYGRQVVLERDLTKDGWNGPHGWNL